MRSLIQLSVLQVSSEGIMTFRRPLLSSSPTPFPFGTSRLPAVAPLWMDLDFRDSTSRVFHRTFDNSRSPSLGEAFLNKFNRRLPPGSNFRAEWVGVFTWSDVVPYPHYAYQDCYTGVSTAEVGVPQDFPPPAENFGVFASLMLLQFASVKHLYFPLSTHSSHLLETFC